MSAKLFSEVTYLNLTNRSAMALRIRWYEQARYFFLRVEEGMVVFKTTDMFTVFCLSDIHRIGVLFSNIMIPVTDRLVTLFRAWSASRKTVSLAYIPFGGEHISGDVF